MTGHALIFAFFQEEQIETTCTGCAKSLKPNRKSYRGSSFGLVGRICRKCYDRLRCKRGMHHVISVRSQDRQGNTSRIFTISKVACVPVASRN